MAQAITVGVRVRPFNTRELKYQSKCIVDMRNNTTFLSLVRQGKRIDEKPREFTFDYAFWTHARPDEEGGEPPANPAERPFADQVLVYNALGKQIVSNATSGYNSCLFAYGQTGSGKTYSMMGTQSDPGILPRIGTDLFAITSKMIAKGLVVQIQCSFAEIYNDVVQDLMNDSQTKDGLPIRKHPKLGIFVQGLKAVTAKTADEFNGLLDHALSSRAVSSTKMNATSSRSHAVILVTVSQTDPVTGTTKTGKMSLVDLAGSERAESTGATGSTMVEAQNINYSLSVLGMCLSKLAEIAEGKAKEKGAHVPFRDSSLTYLLSDNLGGNSKTSMIAALSPADVNYEETLSTLRFASVTKKVKTVAVVNESANAKLIRELKEELAQLKDRLQLLPSKAKDGAAATAAPADEAVPRPVKAMKPIKKIEQTAGEGSEAVATEGGEGEAAKSDAGSTPSGTPPPTNIRSRRHVDPATTESGGESPSQPEGTGEEGAGLIGKPFRDFSDDSDAEGDDDDALVQQQTMAALDHLESDTCDASQVLKRPQLPPSLALGRVTGGGGPPALGGGLKLNLAAMSTTPRSETGKSDASTPPATATSTARGMPPPLTARTINAAIDWRKPLLVRLNRSSTNDAAAIQLKEGDTNITFGDKADSVFSYNALTRETTVRGKGVFHNGMLVDEIVLLRHNDRVILGGNVFRFSHGEGLGNSCDYEKEPTTEDHCILLEKFGRASLIEARAKDAMAILKAYLGPILQQRANPGSVTSSGPIDTSGIATPRGSHPVVGAILDDLAFYNAASFKLEAELAEEYPSTAPAGAMGIPEDTTTELDAALDEQKRLQTEKEEIVRQLREELARAASQPAIVAVQRARSQSVAAASSTGVSPNQHGGATPAKEGQDQPSSAQTSHQPLPDAASSPSKAATSKPQSPESPQQTLQQQQKQWAEDDAKEAQRQDKLDQTCVTTVLSHEMAWHREVRMQRQFRPSPADQNDYAIWVNLAGNPPFMSDSILALQRTHQVSVCDPLVNRTEFVVRCVALSTQFLYVFKKLDGRERVLTAIYLPGCTTALREAKDKTHILDVMPACPRSTEDRSVSGAQAMLMLQFKRKDEGLAWAQWIQRHATPEQPISMLKRSLLQFVQESATCDPASTVDFSRGTAIVEVGAPFDLRNAWKHDSTAKGCSKCKKDFFLFRRRHHCRDCGGIFCADCLDKTKKCEQCRKTTTTQKGMLTSEANTRQLTHNVITIPSGALANGDLLQEYFQARVKKWNSVDAYRALALTPDFDANQAPTSLLADLYRGRLDKWPAASIHRFRRCPMNPNVLLLWIIETGSNSLSAAPSAMLRRQSIIAHAAPQLNAQPQASVMQFFTVSFANGASRERAFESLSMLIGRRAYLGPTTETVALQDESDLLVEHRPEVLWRARPRRSVLPCQGDLQRVVGPAGVDRRRRRPRGDTAFRFPRSRYARARRLHAVGFQGARVGANGADREGAAGQGRIACMLVRPR
jgi:hypothetical protein